MKKKKIIVIIPENLSSGVINSQIFDFFDRVNAEILYLAFSKINIPVSNLIYVEKYKNIKKHLREFKPDYVYIRSSLQYFKLFIHIKKHKIDTIYAFRAFIFVESYFRNNNILSAGVLYFMELFAYLSATKITAVTYNLKRKFRTFFLIPRKSVVIPCYCLTLFDKKITPPEELNMVYIGGASKWQCTEETLILFEKLACFFPQITLTIYSNDQSSFLNLKNTVPTNIQNKIKIVSKPRSLLIKELPKYDLGFLLRRKSLVNEVASPIKFYEYINAGVLPLITPYIGDISNDPLVKDFALYYNFNPSIDDLVNKIKIFLNNKKEYKDKIAFFEKRENFNQGLKAFEQLL